jgi:hypothetical protein
VGVTESAIPGDMMALTGNVFAHVCLGHLELQALFWVMPSGICDTVGGTVTHQPLRNLSSQVRGGDRTYRRLGQLPGPHRAAIWRGNAQNRSTGLGRLAAGPRLRPPGLSLCCPPRFLSSKVGTGEGSSPSL